MKANTLSSRTTRLALALVAAASVAAPSLALAEVEEAGGYVAELEVNHSSADKYLQWHGRVMLVTGGKNATSSEYRWGGTACGTRTLTEDKVALLQRAMEAGMRIIPRMQEGQGNSKCLVGFRMLANCRLH